MQLIDYRAIREAGRELGSEIFKYAVENNKHDLISAAKLLGFWDGKMMVFNSDNDSETLMDFMVFEKIYKDKLLSAISLAAFKKRRKLNGTEIFLLIHEKNLQFGKETRTEEA